MVVIRFFLRLAQSDFLAEKWITFYDALKVNVTYSVSPIYKR